MTTHNTMKSKKDTVEDSFIKDYVKYIEYLIDHNYRRDSINIYENLSALVTINSLKKADEGIVIDIKCPPGNIMSFIGIKSFSEDYRIEDIPPFEIKLADSNGEEIDENTKIKILKNKILRKPEEICEVLYKDISMTNYSESPNKFKNYNELFRFDRGIELKGEDHLKLYVINPDKDIDTIKFNLGADLWRINQNNL